jgi:hypothetical protein
MPPFSVMSLLEEFADETKKSGGNFFTPVESRTSALFINSTLPKLFDFHDHEHTISLNPKGLDYDALLQNRYEMLVSKTTVC